MLKKMWKNMFGCSCCKGCLKFGELAIAASKKEGGSDNQNIAEIREMLSVVLNLLADHAEEHCEECVMDLIRRRGHR